MSLSFPAMPVLPLPDSLSVSNVFIAFPLPLRADLSRRHGLAGQSNLP